MSFSLPSAPMMDASSTLDLHRHNAQAAAARRAEGTPAEAGVDPRMQQAAEGFEALFLQQMLKAGRAASLGDDLLGGSGVERMQSMLDQTLTENAANQAGLGLADAIVRQFAPLAKKVD